MKSGKTLEGLSVLDFSWVVVGPLLTRHLADYGATVLRVESSKHPDTLRTSAPFKDDEPGIDRSGYASNYAAGKYSITLDLSHQKGVEIARRLVTWADIVIESFAPGVIDRLGLGYDELQKVKPDIIMVSTAQLRESGTYPPFRGFGMHGAALAGFYSITGWPGKEPGKDSLSSKHKLRVGFMCWRQLFWTILLMVGWLASLGTVIPTQLLITSTDVMVRIGGA